MFYWSLWGRGLARYTSRACNPCSGLFLFFWQSKIVLLKEIISADVGYLVRLTEFMCSAQDSPPPQRSIPAVMIAMWSKHIQTDDLRSIKARLSRIPWKEMKCRTVVRNLDIMLVFSESQPTHSTFFLPVDRSMSVVLKISRLPHITKHFVVDENKLVLCREPNSSV